MRDDLFFLLGMLSFAFNGVILMVALVTAQNPELAKTLDYDFILKLGGFSLLSQLAVLVRYLYVFPKRNIEKL